METLNCLLDMQACGRLIASSDSGASIMLPLLPLMVLLATMVAGIWKDNLKGYLSQNPHVLILITVLLGVFIVFRANFGVLLPLIGLAIWELLARLKWQPFFNSTRGKAIGSFTVVCLLLAGVAVDAFLKARIRSQIETENNNLYVNFLLPPTSRSIGLLVEDSPAKIDEISYGVHRQLLKSFEETFYDAEVVAVFPSFQEMGSLQKYQDFKALFGAKGRHFDTNLLKYFSSTSRWADYLLDSYISTQPQGSGVTITFSLLRFDFHKKKHFRTPVVEFELRGSLNAQDIDRMGMVSLLKISAYLVGELPFSKEQKEGITENVALSYNRFLKQNRSKIEAANDSLLSFTFASQWQSGQEPCPVACIEELASALAAIQFNPQGDQMYNKKLKTAEAVLLNVME